MTKQVGVAVLLRCLVHILVIVRYLEVFISPSGKYHDVTSDTVNCLLVDRARKELMTYLNEAGIS
jgi:hypothetical protein